MALILHDQLKRLRNPQNRRRDRWPGVKGEQQIRIPSGPQTTQVEQRNSEQIKLDLH
jgi:hypothetical protein